MRKSARAALRHAYLIYFVVAALCLLTLGFVVVRQENTRYEHSVRELVARDALDVAKGIEEKLFSMELIANRLAAIATVADEVPEKLITDAARSLVSHHPDIITVAIAPDLKVAHVAPLAGNELVLGMDYRDLPEQLASISHAYRAHAPVLAGPVNLVQGGTGYVMRYPVYTAAGTGFWGVISIVFKEEGLFAVHSDQRNFEGEIDFALKAAAAEGDWGQKYFGDPAVFDRDPVMQSASILNGAWVVAAAPVGAWPMISPKMVPIILVLVLAAAVVAAIVYKIRSLTKQNERTHKILSNAVEALDAGFVLYDEQDRLMVCNSTFRSYYEPTIQEMKPGIRYQTLIKLAAQGRKRGVVEYSDEEWIADRLAAHKGGQEFLYERYDGDWLKITETRTAEGFSVSVLANVTEQKEAQAMAEEANRQKTEFLSNVTHELRTPLTVINGYAQFLQQTMFMPQRARLQELLEEPEVDSEVLRAAVRDFDDSVAEYAGRIGASSTHMLNMVNDLLDWAEVERGVIKLQSEERMVSDVFADVVEDLRPQAESKGLKLLTSFEEAPVFADPKRMRQALYNLIANAIKFTDEGSITVTAKAKQSTVRFVVEDTGCGIDAHDLERIFERFQQVDGSNTRAYGGFGLGLAITKQIVESHGGRISATSKVGQGSRFVCEWPMYAPEEPVEEDVDGDAQAVDGNAEARAA